MTSQNNTRAPLLAVLHSSLRREDGSAFKSKCPVCDDGVLSVQRDLDTFALSPDDRCTACGQRVSYLDDSIAGQPVVRVCEKPKRKKLWTGRRVRIRRDMENKAGDIFRAGEVMEVRRNFGGLELRSLSQCAACFKGRWRAIKGISESDVDLLPASITSGMDSRDPSLILVNVRRILTEGLRYHEHDGHSMPKKVVRDALALIGIPEEDQP